MAVRRVAWLLLAATCLFSCCSGQEGVMGEGEQAAPATTGHTPDDRDVLSDHTLDDRDVLSEQLSLIDDDDNGDDYEGIDNTDAADGSDDLDTAILDDDDHDADDDDKEDKVKTAVSDQNVNSATGADDESLDSDCEGEDEVADDQTSEPSLSLGDGFGRNWTELLAGFNHSNFTYPKLNLSLYKDLNLSLYKDLNLSLYKDLNLSLYKDLNLSLDSGLNLSHYTGLNLSWALAYNVNYTHNISLNATESLALYTKYIYSRSLKHGEDAAVSKRPNKTKSFTWLCYNGSGQTYGSVKLVNLTQLSLFIHRLACCDRKHCPTVAEQEAMRWNMSRPCSASARHRFLALVMAGRQCSPWDVGPVRSDAPVSIRFKRPLPLSLDLFWDFDEALLSQHPASVFQLSPSPRPTTQSDTPQAATAGTVNSSNSSHANGTSTNTTTTEDGGKDKVTQQRCQCSVLMIYSPTCPFSVKLSPVYSALARQYPALPFLAANADENSTIHYIYSVVGLPTVILLHKHKQRYFARSFTDWSDLQQMSSFVSKHTGLKPLPNITVNASDYETGLPTEVTPQTDYMLILSTIYTVGGLWYLAVR